MIFKSVNKLDLKRKYFLTTIICFIALNLYIFFRFRWGMFDLFCPTFQLNLLDKVSDYGVTVDHLGVPGIPLNYHYLPALLTSTFVNLGFSKLLSFYFAITVGLNCTFLLIILYSRKLILNLKKLKNITGIIFLLICLFSSSGYLFTLFYPYVGYWFKYLSIAEYGFSFSFTFAFLIISFQFILLRNPIFYANNLSNFPSNNGNLKFRYFLSSFMIIFLPYINPTVFVVSSLAHVIFFFKELFLSGKLIKQNSFKNKLIIFLILCLPVIFAYLISKYFILSAFYSSELYENPVKSFGPKGVYDIFMLLILLTPTFYLSIITLPSKLKLENLSIQFITCVISFILPFILYIEGIGFWDNTHKYVLLTSFSSIFILVDNLTVLTNFNKIINFKDYTFGFVFINQIKYKLKGKKINSKFIYLIIFILNILLSFPSLGHQLFTRTLGKDIFLYTRQISNKSNYIYKYLVNQKLIYKNQGVLFVPLWECGICDKFVDIASTNKNFYVLGGYSPNSPFLLSKKIELENSYLINNKHDFDKIENLYPNHKVIYISINGSKEIISDKNIEINFINKLKPIGNFGEYTLFTYKYEKFISPIKKVIGIQK